MFYRLGPSDEKARTINNEPDLSTSERGAAELTIARRKRGRVV